MSFESFLDSYNQSCTSKKDWEKIQATLSETKEAILESIRKELKDLADSADADELFEDLEINEDDVHSISIEVLIEKLRKYGQDKYADLYGKTYSDTYHKKMIDIAKVIALYKGTQNYHYYFLNEKIQEDDLEGNDIWQIQHDDLLVTKNDNGTFTLMTFKDVLDWHAQSGKLENTYNHTVIDPKKTMLAPNCKQEHRTRYENQQNQGTLTLSIFPALKKFVEKVYNKFDAAAEIDLDPKKKKAVDNKIEAFKQLSAQIQLLSPESRAELNRIKIGTDNFGSVFEQVAQGSYCVSKFSGELAKILYRADRSVSFENKEANDLVEEHKDWLSENIRITDADPQLNNSNLDKEYLENLQKIILNTKFDVLVGVGVSLDGKSNRVPSSVANIFALCQAALTGNADIIDTKYKILAYSQERLNDSSRFSLSIFRQDSTNRFYQFICSDPESDNIMRNNESLDLKALR